MFGSSFGSPDGHGGGYPDAKQYTGSADRPRFVFQRDGKMTDCEVLRPQRPGAFEHFKVLESEAIKSMEDASFMWGFEAAESLSSYLAGQRVMRAVTDRVRELQSNC